MIKPKIVVVDYGSQLTKLIVRILREAGYRSALLNPAQVGPYAHSNDIQAIILSGSYHSVNGDSSPEIPKSVLKLNRQKGVPVLGICYGMQLLAQHFGGTVTTLDGSKEFGDTTIKATNAATPLLAGFLFNGGASVWASHSESISSLPPGFVSNATAFTEKAIVVMSDESRGIYGVQFHPEATHTENGSCIFTNFMSIAGCDKDWDEQDQIAEIQEVLQTAGGVKENVVIGFSGGVDSTALAAIASNVFGSALYAITIDHGGLRHNEIKHIKKAAKFAGVNLTIIEASNRFIKALAPAKDGEERRAAFRKVYQAIFNEFIESVDAKYILQGTIAPDLIESGSDGKSTVIKTHHNVDLSFDAKEVLPFAHLFKYEIRALAESVGLPAFIFNRQPFPGPGLFIRIFDDVITRERLDLVREADRRVTEILQATGDYENINQTVVALCTAKSVGVKGDDRVLGYGISIRAVVTQDFMTVKPYGFKYATLMQLSSAVTTIDGIVRMEVNYTTKPPGTTEYM